MELGFLHGRDKLDAPVSTLLSGQEGEDGKDNTSELPLGQTKESAEEAQGKSVKNAGGAGTEERP